MDSQPAVILTGASRGIGLAALELLLAEKVSVVALSRSEPPELTALASKYPGSLVISKGDVSKDEDNKAAVDLAIQSFGRLDALILNAGVADQMGFISTLELSAVRELFEINFFSLVSILTHAVPYLKSSEGKPASQPSARGRVILVSSGAATGKTASWGPYNASKAAMNSLGRTLASEEPDIVTVAVRPGVVDTSMQLLIRESGQKVMTDADYKKFKGFHEAGELLKPSQPGGVIAGLALTADSKLSGTFVNWNDEGIAEYTLAKL